MAYDGYNIYLNYQAGTSKEYFRTNLQNRINRDFSDTLNVYDIQAKDRITGTFSDLTVRVVNYGQEYSFFAHDDYKKIIFQNIDYEVYLGDIFEFEGHRWIATQTNALELPTASCVVQRCNSILKFTESTPINENIIEVDCVIQNRLHDSKNDVFIDLPQGKLQVIIPYDENTAKIRVSSKPTRFLLGTKDYRGFYKAWEVENIDTIQHVNQNYYASTPSVYTGIYNMLLKETQIDKVNDNHTDGVAWQRYFTGGG